MGIPAATVGVGRTKGSLPKLDEVSSFSGEHYICDVIWPRAWPGGRKPLPILESHTFGGEKPLPTRSMWQAG